MAQPWKAPFPWLLLISTWRCLKNKQYQPHPALPAKNLEGLCRRHNHHHGSRKCQRLLTTSQQPAALHPLRHGDRKWQQDRLSRHISHKRTRRRHTTSVYRKPTHVDQYLEYDSHHPLSVKRGIVKCLYDRGSVSQPSLQLSLRRRNIYHLFLFLTVILLLFLKSNTTLKSHLVRTKDAVRLSKIMAWSVYMISCEFTSAKLGDICNKELRSTTGIFDSPIPRH